MPAHRVAKRRFTAFCKGPRGPGHDPALDPQVNSDSGSCPTPVRNPLTSARDLDDEGRIKLLFPALQATNEDSVLALRSYLTNCPERFFNQELHSLALDWLITRDEAQPARLRQYFDESHSELSAGLLFLRQINSEDWHDRRLADGDDYDTVSFIDKTLHPAYLRLVESVFAQLIRPFGIFSRLDRNARVEGLDVFNLVEELSRGQMAPVVAAYQHTMRNGIGHGGIILRNREIRYRDKKGNTETFDLSSVIRTCDDMLDTCNALASAFKVFLILKRQAGYKIPREFLVEELMESTKSPWWRINGCMESEVPQGSQLLIYAQASSRDRLVIHWAAIHSAALAEAIAPGFDRYFISIRSRFSWPGWAAFDGRRLRDIRVTGASEVHDYAPATEEMGFFYSPRITMPGALRRIDTIVKAFQLQWPKVKREVQERRGLPEVIARDARVHRNSWGLVLNAAVVMPNQHAMTVANAVRRHKRRIVRLALHAALKQLSALSPLRVLPLAYARVSVFSEDFRRRRLSNFGLGPRLVCTVQLQRLRRIKAPDIYGSTVETLGNWRIAWNRAWIDSGGMID